MKNKNKNKNKTYPEIVIVIVPKTCLEIKGLTYVGYHTRKITLPVMPLTVPVTLPISVMSAARTSTVRPFIKRLF
jgi:hypothetical protein